MIATRLAFAIRHYLAAIESDAKHQQFAFCYRVLCESNERESNHFLQSLILIAFDDTKYDFHSMEEVTRFCSFLPITTKHGIQALLQSVQERMSALNNRAEDKHILHPVLLAVLHSTLHRRRGEHHA